MAFKKPHLFPEQDQLLSQYFRSLAHAARVGILRQLAEMESATVESLAKNKPISRPTFSEHLHLLRVMHLIHFDEKFPHTYYRMDRSTRDHMKKLMTQFLESI